MQPQSRMHTLDICAPTHACAHQKNKVSLYVSLYYLYLHVVVSLYTVIIFAHPGTNKDLFPIPPEILVY